MHSAHAGQDAPCGDPPRLLVGLLPLLFTTLICWTTPLTRYGDGYDSDGKFYAAMAGDPLFSCEYSRAAPWCFRILTPWLASLLPLQTLDAFRVIGFAAGWLSLTLLLWILRRLEFDERLSAIGLALYAAVFWSVKFSFRSPAYIDSLTQSFLLAIVLLTLGRRYLAVVMVVAVGALQKESVPLFGLFALVSYAGQEGRTGRRVLAYAICLIVLPLLVLVSVRASIQPIRQYSTAGAVLESLSLAVTPGMLPRLVHAALSGLGILPALLLLRPAASLGFLLRHREWLALAGVGLVLLFGGRDRSRLFLYVLPVAVVLAVNLLAVLGRPGRIWLAVTLVIHAAIGRHRWRIGWQEEYLASLVPEHSPGLSYVPNLVGTALVLTVWFFASRRLLAAGRPPGERAS
ncbi:MAG: hypothetical protein HY815_33310 [Candidatus Riflebacteria bacterium]|nr:hypothetical protein [Candidatus Riflebacteria bacterium]